MKKIFSFVMALSLVASAYAMLPIQEVVKPSKKGDARMEMVQHQTVNVPGDMQIAKEAKFEKMFKNMHQDANVSKARRAANGNNYTITISDGYAMFLGDMYEQYGYDYGYYWDLEMTGTGGEMASLMFVGYSTERIAGYYHNVSGYVCVNPGDTLEAKGDIEIKYVSAGSQGSSPVYQYSGELADSLGNTYTLSGSYAFPEGEVLNYLWYMYCYYYSYGCEYSEITLEDNDITPAGTETITITEPATKTYYKSDEAWYIYAMDNDYYASVQVYTEKLTDGHYDTKDMDYGYTNIYSFEGGDTTAVDMYKPVSLDVTTTKDTIFFVMKMIGTDATEYTVNMFYPVINITDTILSATMGTLYDYIEDYGLIMFKTSNDSITLMSAVYSESLTGQFTEADSYYGGYYDVLYKISGTDTLVYLPESYKFTIIEGTDQLAGYYVVNMYFNAYNTKDRSDAHCFHIVGALEVPNPYKYDQMNDTSFTVSANLKDIVYSDTFEQYGLVLVNAWNADSTTMFYGAFVLNSLDPATIIPQDVYDIDDSEEAPSMLASEGYDGEMNYPTYLTMFIGGYQYVWYIVDGTATMQADKLVVNGINSNGKTVTVTINFLDVAIDEVMDSAAALKVNKFMHNGNIYLMKDNQLFNLLGGQVK